MADSCANGNERSSYIKGVEFIDQLRDYQLKYDSAPSSQEKALFYMAYVSSNLCYIRQQQKYVKEVPI